MNGFPGSRVRIAAVLTLVVGAVVLLLTYRGYHERRLLLGGVYLLTAAGVLAQLFWLMRYRLLWIASLTSCHPVGGQRAKCSRSFAAAQSLYLLWCNFSGDSGTKSS